MNQSTSRVPHNVTKDLVHQVMSELPSQMRCRHCGSSLWGLSARKRLLHVLEQHPVKIAYQCVPCNYYTRNVTAMRMHTRRRHDVPIPQLRHV